MSTTADTLYSITHDQQTTPSVIKVRFDKLKPSVLPRRRELIELQERMRILGEYHNWDRQTGTTAWILAVKLHRTGLHIGAILAQVEDSLL